MTCEMLSELDEPVAVTRVFVFVLAVKQIIITSDFLLCQYLKYFAVTFIIVVLQI